MQPNQQFTVILSRQFPPSSYVYSTLHLLQVHLSAVNDLTVELPEIYTVFVNGALCHGPCVEFQNIHILLSLESCNFKGTVK
jgi:hypothetical protein